MADSLCKRHKLLVFNPVREKLWCSLRVLYQGNNYTRNQKHTTWTLQNKQINDIYESRISWRFFTLTERWDFTLDICLQFAKRVHILIFILLGGGRRMMTGLVLRAAVGWRWIALSSVGHLTQLKFVRSGLGERPPLRRERRMHWGEQRRETDQKNHLWWTSGHTRGTQGRQKSFWDLAYSNGGSHWISSCVQKHLDWAERNRTGHMSLDACKSEDIFKWQTWNCYWEEQRKNNRIWSFH